MMYFTLLDLCATSLALTIQEIITQNKRTKADLLLLLSFSGLEIVFVFYRSWNCFCILQVLKQRPNLLAVKQLGQVTLPVWILPLLSFVLVSNCRGVSNTKITCFSQRSVLRELDMQAFQVTLSYARFGLTRGHTSVPQLFFGQRFFKFSYMSTDLFHCIYCIDSVIA